MKFLKLFAAVLLSQHGAIGQTLSPKKYLSLPLGQILPTGWLYDQLYLQTNGLGGSEIYFYDYVQDTDWTGGDSLYSNLEEAGSYWFNGMVPNAVLMNNTDLISKVTYFLEYVIDHQDSTGWLGPEVNTTKPRYLWGRYPFFFGAIQMTEAFPQYTTQVVDALYKFVALANTMLHNNAEGVEPWGAARWEDFVITLQWLFDNHPNGNQSLLIDTMQQLKYYGLPWDEIFLPEYFPTGPVENLPNPFNTSLTWHGVNVAEGLKALPSAYRFTHNESDLSIISTGWDLLFQYHGRPSGIYAADEYLAGLEAARGTELCLVVETMFSGSYLYQIIGDPKYLDRVERITYNALPAELTGDMWSRQYLQQQNQIAAKNMNPDPFATDGSYSNVFGLEPNYPCCTVNHPQGYPKFITNSFVVTADNTSLVNVYLGPFNTKTSLAGGNIVSVSIDTIYPFSDTLTTTITARKAFTYYVRIPSWVTNGTIAINGAAAKAVNPSNGLQAISVAAGTTKFVLDLPAAITLESRPHGSIAVQRGPLHYAFDIARNATVLAQNSEEINAKDYEFDATVPWQYAIDPNSLVFHSTGASSLPSPVYDSGLPPLTIGATACLVNWTIAGDTFASPPPTSPVECTGAKTNITLWPYGATKLRISEFPVFSS